MNIKKSQGVGLLALIAALVFFLGFENAGLQLTILRIADEFRLNTAMMGVLIAAQYLAITVMQPIFGLISDKTGKKRVIILAVLLFIAGCVCVMRSYSAEMFIGGIFLLGTGYSAAESLGMAALADAYPSRSDRYISLSQSVFCAGAVLSPLLSGKLMNDFGRDWRIVFALSAAGFALLLIPLILTRFPVAVSITEAQRIPIGKFMSVSFIILVTAMLLYGGIETGIGSFLDILFSRELGAAETGTYALSLYWLAMMLSRLFFGLVKTRANYTVAGGMMVCAIALTGLALSKSEALSIACSVAIGAALGPVWPMLVDMGAKMHTANSGSAVTLMSASCGLGAAGMPVMIGWISEYSGLRPAVFAVSILGWIAFLIFLPSCLRGLGKRRID